MSNFPQPSDEEQRLEVLRGYEILDTPPEATFERVTALATRLLGVPIALVSLVDADRQWFKSACGLDIRETPRSMSFCAHALMDDDMLIVPDATRDPRFADNPLVTGPLNIRFYAGAPLRVPGTGYRLGTLCAIGHEPRGLDAAGQQTLRDLAAIVVDGLEHRRETRRRERVEADLAREQSRRYRQLVEQATDGFFIHDFEGQLLDVNQAACDQSGYTREELLGLNLDAVVVGFDFSKVKPMWEDIAPGHPLTLTARHRRKDGSTYPVEARLSVFRQTMEGDGGDPGADHPRRLFALVRDTTERQREEDILREANEQLERRVLERTVALGHANADLQSALDENNRLAVAVDSVALGVIIVDTYAPDRPVVFANPAFSTITGYPLHEVLGRNCNFLQGPETDRSVVERVSAAIRDGQPFHDTLLNYRRDGTPFWNEVTISPVQDGENRPRYFIGVQVDVTTRREDEERLRLLESAVVNANDGIIMTGTGGEVGVRPSILYVNRALARMTGYRAEELVGQPPNILWGPDTSMEDLEQVSQILRRMEPVHLEMVNRRKDGSEFWVEVNIMPVADEQGRFTHTVGIQRDITARKGAEDALRASENRYRDLFGTNPLPTWVYDVETLRFLEVNPAAVTHYGYTREEFLRMSLHDILPPAEASALVAALAAPGPVPPEQTQPWHHRKKDGGEIVVETTVDHLTFAGRQARLVVAHDVTEQRRMERALRESQVRFERMTANVPGMVYQFVRRADGFEYFSFVSEGCRELYGLEPEALLHDPAAIADLVEPADRPGFAAAVTVSVETLQPWHQEWTIRLTPDGRPKHVQAFARPERRENGDTVWDGVVLDVTERKHTEELERAKEAAERANRAKSEFLSRMSHELRTPLNAILGFGQLLEIEPLSPPQTQSVEHILKGGRHLLGLIDEVLDISRIESGNIALSLGPVEVTPLLEEALSLVRHMTIGRKVHLRGIVPGGHGAPGDGGCAGCVQADRSRLKQVLVNLLSNAIKYNRPEGEVELHCVEVPPPDGDPGAGRVRLTVRDTGMGIAPELLVKLFTPFERLGAMFGPVEGTGLGLAVSKRLAEAMGGTLGVESTPGVGSSFWVEVPRPAAAGPAPAGPAVVDYAPAESIPVPDRCQLLYIEDNESNVRLVQRIVEHQRPDWQILAAPDGPTGLAMARKAPPDAILLDLQLPGMAGDAVLARLQTDPRTQGIPVVLLSADANPHSHARLLSEGARAYLTKPLNVRGFLTTVDAVLAGLPPPENVAGPPAAFR